MVKKRAKRGAQVPLIIEPHPADYDGYPFITLIQYRNQHVLAIIDNADDKIIKAFVLDMCGPEQVDEERVITVASEWYEHSRERYPLSFEFSKRGIADEMAKIVRAYNTDFVTRVIGPLPKFGMQNVKSVKRRRRKPVPAGVEISRKVIPLR